jgi:DNA-binding LacI/PurR family transcriptional regulator
MDPAPGRAPNIRDVAREAGVSYQTVSRVLNDSPSIRPSTRERVLGVIETLGYRPNAAARALVTSRSKTIGVLSSQSALYGPTTSIQSIEQAARVAGYRLSVTEISTSGYDSVRAGLDFLLSQSIDALVILAAQVNVFEAVRKLRISVPFAMLQATDLDAGHSVSVDQAKGARIAVRHLIDLGHTKILHIAGPAGWIEAEERSEGYRVEISSAGLRPLKQVVGDWTADFGYLAGRELLSNRDFTAVFCCNDQTALGFLHACRDAGVRVPEDLSVIGFDDIPESSHFPPPLTTVKQDFVEIGRRAVAVLLEELGGHPVTTHEPIPPVLTLRLSTAAPAPLSLSSSPAG